LEVKALFAGLAVRAGLQAGLGEQGMVDRLADRRLAKTAYGLNGRHAPWILPNPRIILLFHEKI
jgi:hypothetical protein